MRRTVILLLALGLAAPAFAADKPKDDAGNGPVGQYIDLTPLALPVISGGIVKNYIYLRVRVNLTSNVDAEKARDKEPYLRDALIHAGYRTPFTSADSYLKLDEAKLGAAVARDSVAILGPGKVASVVVMSQDPQHVSNVGRPN